MELVCRERERERETASLFLIHLDQQSQVVQSGGAEEGHKLLPLVFSCSEAGEPPYITSAGFQFLLLDTASQLWYFTLQYLKTAQVSGTAAASHC